MKFLLTTLNAKYIHANLAIRLLYHLNKNEFPNLEWKEFTIKENFHTISEYCANYELVAFSCYIWNIQQTLEVCKQIKSISPQTQILLGGPEVSYEWEEMLKLEFVDYIIVGEGEYPFQEFLRQFPNPQNIAGLAYKVEHQLVFESLNKNFDLQNYQNINPYEYESSKILKTKVLYIETSRGCPYKCEFCLASLDNKVRYLPIETIKKNLLFLMKNGKVIKFLDRTFNVKKDFTLEIFQFILEHHEPDNIFQFEITADILHPEIIQFIQKNIPKGLFRFEIGIQTVNTESNLAVKRKQNFEKTQKIIQQVKDFVDIHADLIVGLPYEGWKEIEWSFNQVFALFPDELQLGFLKFLKGTPLRNPVKIREHEYIYEPHPPYQMVKSKYLGQKELKEIQIIENTLEIYWNKGRLKNTLKYLSAYFNMFELFWELGKLFTQKHSFHKHTLDDVYEVAEIFFSKFYSNYPEIQEILALDYYSYFTTKPKIRFLEDQLAIKNAFFSVHKMNKIKPSQSILLSLNNFQKLSYIFKDLENTHHSNYLLISYHQDLLVNQIHLIEI